MFATYAKLFDLLTRREKRRFGALLGLVVLSGLADMAGVAAILPFLAVMTDPALARESAWLSPLYRGLGFASDDAFLVFLGAAVFSFILVALTLKLLTLYGLARFSHMRNHSVSNRLLDAMVRQPYSYYLGRNTADLGKTVLHEVDRVIVEALMPAIRLLAHAVSLVCLVALLVAIEPVIAFLSGLVLGTAYVGIFVAVRKALSRLGQIRTEMNATRYRLAQEALAGIKDIKVRGAERTYTDRYGAASLKLAETASTAQAIGELPRNLLEALAFGGMVALVLGLLLTGSGNLMEIVPVLGVFAFAGLKMFPNLQQIYHATTLLRFIRPTLDSVHREVLATRDAAMPPPSPEPVPPLRLGRSLELRALRFGYPGASLPALDGLSLKVPAGAKVGIVGGSGAGKSTLVDILLGLLKPDSGAILADGATVGPASLPSWREAIGYVPQAIHLTDASVAANIAFGVPSDRIDMTAVARAARVANLHDFITASLPEGYDTEVGERGLRLSGGQRQRIAIARALYHDPDILIFDEATSALDNLTEREVMDAVRNIGGRKTVIMVAHRLSTVKDCDMIALVERGRIAAVGTFDELVRGNAAFRRMAAA